MRLLLVAFSVAVAALWAVGCSRPVRVISPPPPTAKGSVVTAPTPDPVPQRSVVVEPNGNADIEPPPVEEPEPTDLPRRPLPRLESFYGALSRLVAGQRNEPVRVLWMGDSHTAADFMTHELRLALQNVVGAGGPGFIRLGMDGYRHGEVQFSTSGRWRKEPILPAQRTRVLDGIFGYGGIRTIPFINSSVVAKVKDKYARPMRWTLSYRLGDDSALRVGVGQDIYDLVQGDELAEETPSGVSYRTFEGEGEFKVSHLAGKPEIFGAYVETLAPGIVLDTVGINGARAATALAWEAQQFSEAVRLRGIELLVLAYGTNEVFDRTDPARYGEHLTEIVKRVRAVESGVPCWIVAPPDAATDDGRSRTRVALVTEVQRQAAEDAGCAFSSAMELMGGEGSFARWMSMRPSLARSDHVHLTIAGYRQLGQLLAHELLGEGAAETASPVD